jgi:hypothetical protein
MEPETLVCEGGWFASNIGRISQNVPELSVDVCNRRRVPCRN